MKKLLATALLSGSLLMSTAAFAADYAFDIKGMHASIQFRVKHLGYSWLYGRFNQFDGNFSYDEAKPEAAKVSVTIDTTSLDSNHAERDKHLRSADFLETDKFPEAKFTSTAYKPAGDGKGTLEGELTLHGVTKPITIAVEEVGAGEDPWGGYRRGFTGTTKFMATDFGLAKGKMVGEVEMFLDVEGIRQ